MDELAYKRLREASQKLVDWHMVPLEVWRKKYHMPDGRPTTLMLVSELQGVLNGFGENRSSEGAEVFEQNTRVSCGETVG
jgi:hypothetical protein